MGLRGNRGFGLRGPGVDEDDSLTPRMLWRRIWHERDIRELLAWDSGMQSPFPACNLRNHVGHSHSSINTGWETVERAIHTGRLGLGVRGGGLFSMH